MNVTSLRKKLPLIFVVLVCAGIMGTGYFNQRATLKKETSEASKKVEAQAQQMKEAAFDPSVLEPAADDLVIGNADAPITIVDYSSLSCTHCAHFHTQVLPKLQKTYIDTGKVKLVYRHFPLNEPALRAAQLVQCAPEAQRLNFLNVLFEMQDKWAFAPSFLNDIKQIAAVGGIATQTFDQCMANKDLETAILTTRKDAMDRAQIDSTPTLFVNGKLLDGAPEMETIEAAIDAVNRPQIAPKQAKKN